MFGTLVVAVLASFIRFQLAPLFPVLQVLTWDQFSMQPGTLEQHLLYLLTACIWYLAQSVLEDDLEQA